MSELDDYLQAADRETTVRSYAAAIKHFEQEWKGLLPATSDTVARYLVAYAGTHKISTLRQRLAALARWHAEQGFADPTKTPLVRKVLRGIVAKHPTKQKQARPLEIDQLKKVSNWLQDAQRAAREQGDYTALLQLTRNRSIVLLGFWRAFRSDEIVNMRVENVTAIAGKGLTCRLDRSKTDRALEGRTFHCPALSRLCPVDAYLEWIAVSGRQAGPVYCGVDQWGHLSDRAMHPTSLIPLLRKMFHDAGVESAEGYSSHSLRRGFAGWARASGWDIKEMMEYVGWRDMESALRYLDAPSTGLQERFESGL